MIRPNQYRLSVCICLLIIAVLLGYVVFFIFFADCLPPLFIHNTERIQVIEADPGTVVELVWVYEADAQSETRDRPDTYQRIRDISFKALSSNDSWSVGENDYLVSDLPLASFELKRPFLTTKAIVYCLKGVNGNAIVSLTSGQNTAYYKLNGNDTEAILLSGLAASEQPFFIMKCVCAGIIALLFLFIAAAVWGMVFHWWTPASLGYVKSKDSIPDEPSKRMPLFQLISAFFIPAAAALTAAIWLGIAPFGERTLIINDSFWENDHFLAFTHDLNFFNGSLQYTFSKALGGDTFSLFTSYMLSPLNWVIKLFPVTAIPIFLTFLSITRIGFCGASFFIFINKTHGLRWSGLIFSTSYALCAYAAAYADSLFFLPPLVYLPLVALGIVKISRGQRPLFFMITLACAVMENYYFGYIFCLFSVIYFIWRTLLTTEFRVLLCRIPVFFAQMAAAAGTAGFILVPSILALSGGPKHLTTFSLTAPLNFSLPDLISKGFPGAFSIAELESGSPMIFCGTLITFLLLSSFCQSLFIVAKNCLPADC